MSILKEIAIFALLAIFAENIVFTRGFGSTELLTIGTKPKKLLFFGVIITVFTTFSSLALWPLSKLLLNKDWANYLRGIIFTVCVATLYLLVVFVLKKLLPALNERISKLLPIAAFNSLVLAIPFIISPITQSFFSAVAFGLGAGIGFVLAAFLLAIGIERINNPDVPSAFRGLPIQLLYIGILSMVFLAFSGHFQFS